MSRPLRVLFVAPYPPSPIRVRPFQLLRALAARGHEIALVCAAGPGDGAALDALRATCRAVRPVTVSRGERAAAYGRALAAGLPLQAAHCLTRPFVRAVREALLHDRFDVVHIEHLRAAEVARAAAAGLPAPPLLLDAVDSISLLFERTARRSPSARARAVALAELGPTRRYEASYGRRFAHITLTSPEDRWAIATLQGRYGEPPGAPLTVVPNGVDLESFAPRDGAAEPETIVFSGKMSYHANEAAALFLLQSIMPLVWRERPSARVVVAGAQPGPAILAHAGHPQVTVTGYLPDMPAQLARATVAVAPIRYGVGVQNKVLEAFAMGLPVVAARQATVALAARPGRELLVADEAGEFAAAILQLLDDGPRRAALGRAGRRYVERGHSWAASAELLEACYRAGAKRIVSEGYAGFTGVLARGGILHP